MEELDPTGKKIWGVAVKDVEKRRCCLGELVKMAMDGALACWLYPELSSLAKSLLLVDPNPCFRYGAKIKIHTSLWLSKQP